MSKLNPPVEIMLDKPRHLKNNLLSEFTFEKVSGKTISQFDMGSSGDLLQRLWSMLLWEDLELTIEELGGMVDSSNVAEIADAMSQAVTGDEPELELEPAESDTPGEILPFTPAGTESGPPEDTTSA